MLNGGRPIAASVQKLSDSVVKLVSAACSRQRQCVRRNRNDQAVYQFEVNFFYT